MLHMNQRAKYVFPFILLCSLFLLWAFVHNLNPILIPHLKKACSLSDTQSAFIDSAVYLAYFVIAIPAGLFMHAYGYKKGILFGLLFLATGAALFVPAASARSYIFFLTALFIMASGATFLETVANPYMANLGARESSAQRLNFAQSFNGVGAFLAPLLGGKFILTGIEHTPDELKHLRAYGQLDAYLLSEAATVQIPYLVIAAVVVLVGLLFLFTRLPEIKEDASDIQGPGAGFSLRVFRHRHLSWAVAAQFFYVGAQVGVGSFFIRYAKYVADMGEKRAAFLWGSVAMVGFMAGRFTGTFLMRYLKPATLLSLYAFINIVLLTIAVTLKGQPAIYAVMAVPFFMSIMFPTIFALGIRGLGEETKIGSSFLVMSIIGGGLAAPAMGFLSDRTGSIQVAYVVPLACFAVVLYYGMKGYKMAHAAQA
jgi:FHS family L-fucose permease-like MFS transporter